jgi:hypothetical protein
MRTSRTEVLGPSRGGREEARELARSCGAEEEAFVRVSLGRRLLPGIPHLDYRVLVTSAALRRSPRPTTKDYALAKAGVDDLLADRGLGVIVPSARPGRVTR